MPKRLAGRRSSIVLFDSIIVVILMDMASISEPSSCHNLYLFLVSWSCYSSLDTSLARTIYLAVIKSLFSDTCSCWSGNASNSAKTPCWQSLQTFITGNNIILRIFSIQYLWGKYLPIWRLIFFLPGGTLIRCSFLCKETMQEHGTCQQFRLGYSLYLQPRILST